MSTRETDPRLHRSDSRVVHRVNCLPNMLGTIPILFRVRPQRAEIHPSLPGVELPKSILGIGHRDIENIIAPNEDVSIVGCQFAASVLGGMVHYEVHVRVALDHPSLIFQVILQLHLNHVV